MAQGIPQGRVPMNILSCKNCNKLKKSTPTLVVVFLNALGTSLFTSMTFWMVGWHLGFPLSELRRGMAFTTILGAMAFLVWVLWQFDKIHCSCGEIKPIEGWLIE